MKNILNIRKIINKIILSIIINTSTAFAGTASVSTQDLVEFDSLPNGIKSMISYSLSLASRGFPYVYGKKSPEEGGFDCSGAVYHTLRHGGITNVPRTAAAQYTWLWKSSTFKAVNSFNPNSFEFSKLKPGDLLFWTGTYDVKRDPPITHVMIYLGRLKKNGKRIMVGASNGRRYAGKSQNGYSVFDFYMPSASKSKKSGARFVGYGTVPNVLKYNSQSSTSYNRYNQNPKTYRNPPTHGHNVYRQSAPQPNPSYPAQRQPNQIGTSPWQNVLNIFYRKPSR